MNKSQLRKLAIQRAQGELKLEEYLRQRQDMIESMVSGKLPIERETPPPRPAPAPASVGLSASSSTSTSTSTRSNGVSGDGTRVVPLHYYFAGGASICILILIWALWPAAQSPVTPATSPAPVKQISVARTLVESFLALRDFSEIAVSDFERNWQQLDDQDRQQARNELWFRSLTRSIRDEVKTQSALAQLADSADGTAKIERLYRLAQTLKISKQLPTRDAISTSPPAQSEPATESASLTAAPSNLPLSPPGISATVESNSEQPSTGTQEQDTSNTATSASPAASGVSRTSREWLDMQADERFTLQIFAVNKLARIEQLMTQHPDLALQIFATEGAVPRYRVYLGSYTGKQQAEQAFAGLAADVRQAAGKAWAKSIAEVRVQLNLYAPNKNSLASVVKDSEPQYTLQLFASNNRDNALALTRKFSALGLELHELSSSPAAYRVIYGRFASSDLAQQASGHLPAELLSRIGAPLVKSLTDLGLK